MFTIDYVRYTHYRPPYRETGRYLFSQQIKPKNVSDWQRLEMTPETAETRNNDGQETNKTVNTAISTDLPAPAEKQEFTKQEVMIELQNAIIDNTINVLSLNLNDAKYTDEGNQNIDLPLTSECILPPQHPMHNAEIMPPKKGQEENRFMDAADSTYCDHRNHGLLNFRKWWERIEVTISVHGTLIKGIPIFVEDNTLRVISNNYSHFIPLEKIDYICTTDGLCSSFHASQ